MTDLNMMMREQALSGLQTQLDKAVTDGDTAAARKISDDIAKLTLQTAPKAPPYGQEEIKAAIEAKAPWFGVDPKKSAKVLQYGKDLNLKKFATPEAVADAIIKAVDEDYATTADPKNDDPTDDGDDNEGDEKKEDKPVKRKTDAPDNDTGGVRSRSRTGPWTKLSDAPADVQTEIRRAADKFVPSNAPKERREGFISKALESHYAAHQRKTGKK